jgi:hypothetical protein
VTFGDAADSSHRTTLLADAAEGGPHAGVRALAVAGARGLVAIGGDDGVVRLVALPGAAAPAVDQSRSLDAGDGPINAVAFGAGGELVAAAARTAVHVWTVADGAAAFAIPVAAEAVTIAPGGERLATGAADGTVQVWRRDGEALGSLSLPSAVRWVGFGSDGVLVAATDHWLHSFSVEAQGLEPLHAWPAPGSLSAARGFAALGAERVRIESFDARGALRAGEIDLAAPRGGAPAAAPELLSRDWPAALGVAVDDAGEVAPVGR